MQQFIDLGSDKFPQDLEARGGFFRFALRQIQSRVLLFEIVLRLSLAPTLSLEFRHHQAQLVGRMCQIEIGFVIAIECCLDPIKLFIGCRQAEIRRIGGKLLAQGNKSLLGFEAPRICFSELVTLGLRLALSCRGRDMGGAQCVSRRRFMPFALSSNAILFELLRERPHIREFRGKLP